MVGFIPPTIAPTPPLSPYEPLKLKWMPNLTTLDAEPPTRVVVSDGDSEDDFHDDAADDADWR